VLAGSETFSRLLKPSVLTFSSKSMPISSENFFSHVRQLLQVLPPTLFLKSLNGESSLVVVRKPVELASALPTTEPQSLLMSSSCLELILCPTILIGFRSLPQCLPRAILCLWCDLFKGDYVGSYARQSGRVWISVTVVFNNRPNILVNNLVPTFSSTKLCSKTRARTCIETLPVRQ
jgi:hypothetical protein